MSTSRPGEFPLGYSSHPPSQPRSASPSASNSPIDPSPSAGSRPPFGLVGSLSSSNIMAGNSRSGAGSPSHDLPASSRLYSKRAREIQAQEGIPGLPLSLWGGPPTSGNSTPLRENIPESPTDGFPDFGHPPSHEPLSQPRRARAGTVPSRFPPGVPAPPHLGLHALGAKSARQTPPSQTPFNSSPSPGLELGENTSSGSALLSRLRAGSMPQRSQFAPLSASASSPFGPSIFSSWNPPNVGRERGSTLASIPSVPSNDPSSPSQSHFSREGGNESDVHMRTLDYLGLAETPQPPRAQMATPYMPAMDPRQASRIRSYSVNNKDIHADEYPDDEYDTDGVAHDSYAALQDQLERTHAAIHHHNMAVQAFASHTTTTRRRAQTAGALDNPAARIMSLPFGSGLAGAPNPVGSSSFQEEQKYDDLPKAVAGLSLGRSNSHNAGLLNVEDQGLDGPTSALWLGNIPTSTTTSTLEEMFKPHGKIISVRVLTHKNCGFVNYERVESAVSAKANMNGKEIFPGASPIRINFAKPASPANTPGHDGAYPSPSPDPFAKDSGRGSSSTPAGDGTAASASKFAAPYPPELADVTAEVLDIVRQLGASDEDMVEVTASLKNALAYRGLLDQIPPIPEPSHSRIHDAPKLRELRKRLDSGTTAVAEVEEVARNMLPEIAELSSDYLGNTVVQKLFEQCSDEVKDAMLAEIAPHLAQIGCHKNGTWAAQKIIAVCKTPRQMSMIGEHIRPYTVPLLLDQYGNYVVQGCLKYGVPYNEFIFETMMCRLDKLSQARFGARAMRATLESHFTTPNQLRKVAAVIAIHSANLAGDSNGSLLVTWYLDTCNLPQRRTALAPLLAPYLIHMATHKAAYLTLVKTLNQKAEPEACEMLLRAIFFNPDEEVLEAIIGDNNYGVTFMFKVLSLPFPDDAFREQALENLKKVVLRVKGQTGQSYKRLMEEIGMPVKNGASGRDPATQPEHRQRPSSRHANMNGHQGQHANPGRQQQPQPQQQQQQFYGAGVPSPAQPQGAYDVGDSGGLQSFPQFSQPAGMMYNGSGGGVPPPVSLQQMQYQQGMMGRPAPSVNYSFPPAQAGYGAYANAGPSIDQYRQMGMSNGSPIQPPAAQMQQMPAAAQGSFPAVAPPGFSAGMAGGYGYGNVGSGMHYGHQGQGHNMRNAVSFGAPRHNNPNQSPN